MVGKLVRVRTRHFIPRASAGHNGVMTVVIEDTRASVEVEHAWVEPTGTQALRRTHDLVLTGSAPPAD